MKDGQIKSLMDTQALLFERLTGVKAKEKERESAQALLIQRLTGVEERLKVMQEKEEKRERADVTMPQASVPSPENTAQAGTSMVTTPKSTPRRIRPTLGWGF